MLSPKEELMLFLRLPGVGAALYWKLLENFPTLSAALKTPFERLKDFFPKDSLEALEDYLTNGENSLLALQVQEDVKQAEHDNIHIIDTDDELYPDLLRQIKRPPPLLYVAGDPALLNFPQIAIVGSRSPSPNGRSAATEFAAELAGGGFTITSGLALGVDACAHKGALSVYGRTIAVLGTGIDTIYPSRNKDLAKEIIDKGGAIVSEFPLGTSALPANFPQRNRIISGLSCGTLIVEAALRSGSLITARYALQQNREVFAIPGSIHSPVSRGCHALIKDGAKLVETAEDIAEELKGLLQWRQESLPLKETAPQVELDSNLITSDNEELVMESLGYDPSQIDTLVERTCLPVGEVMACLMTLELKGKVANNGSGYVIVNHTAADFGFTR